MLFHATSHICLTGADVDERVAAARGDLHPEEHQAEGDHRDEEEGEPGWVQG